MVREYVRRLLDDESGGITIFVLVLTILLLVAGGMAVDYQRYEIARADLQNALDRGVLAATNKNQTYDESGTQSLNDQARQLVTEYFASRNYRASSLDIAVNVTPVPGGRAVTALAAHPLETLFLRLVGVNTLNVAAVSGAIEGVPVLEITLVLDVSGSMGWNSTSAPGTKLAQLKIAAKQFLETVLTEDSVERTLITIVPFSEQVALPRSMADLYRLNRHHDYSSCFDFHSIDFTTAAMPTNPAVAYDQGQHFREDVGYGNYGCPKANNAITAFSNDLPQLKGAIDALSPETYTATYMGMKWGAAALDPSSRPVVDAMIEDGGLPEDFRGWPHDWHDIGVRKITVLMSDGQNTRLNEIVNGVYQSRSLSFWDRYAPPFGAKVAVVDNERTGEGDDLLRTICDRAKIGKNSTIYTIGFELADQPAATAVLEYCASSLSTHYLVEGVEISTAFRNIAEEIVALKLIN